MKVLNKVVIGMASLVLLTACAPKTTYAEFHAKAVAALEKAKEKSFTVTLKGTYKDDNGEKKNYDNITINWNKGSFEATSALHLDEVFLAVTLTALRADVVAESDNTTYYAGSSFKTVYEKDGNKETTTWNQYGLLATVKSSDGDNLKVSYKK